MLSPLALKIPFRALPVRPYFFLFLLLFSSASSIRAGTISLSPQGSDAGDGTEEKPFATLGRAQQAVREKIKLGEAVTVRLHAGTYELQSPLELTAEDSGTAEAPIVWEAVSGEEVRVSGGRVIGKWQKVTDPAVLEHFDSAVRGRIIETNLGEHGITEYGNMSGGFSLNGSTGIELFVADVPMTVSRYPNEGFINITEVTGKIPMQGRDADYVGTKDGVFRVDDKRVLRWLKEKDPRALGYWGLDWAEQHQKIVSIDPQTLTVTLDPEQHQFGYRKGQYFYAYNLLCEIDRPGEWYLDHGTGIVYLMPPNDRVPERAMVTLLPTIVSMKGASNITFQGIIFEGCRDNAVTMTQTKGGRLLGCTIRNSGKWGAVIEGGEKCEIRDSDIYGTGSGGIQLGGGDRATLAPAGHLVENCHIHHYSRWNRTYNPGIRIEGVGSRVANNLIHDAPHQAMQFSGNDHIIELNEIHNVCQESNDAGAVYAWNDWAGRGNILRYNYLHHVYGHDGKGAFGIYLDDAFSTAAIHGNIFLAMKSPVFLGGGRDHRVTDNILVDCIKAFHIDGRGLTWMKDGYEKLKTKLDLVPYQTAPWSKRYPELVGILEDEPMHPKNIFLARNIIVASSWDDIDREAEPYLIMEHNLFDAPREILTSKPDQMPRVNLEEKFVRVIKFDTIPYDKIGLQQTPLRKKWPVEHPVKKQEWKIAP